MCPLPRQERSFDTNRPSNPLEIRSGSNPQGDPTIHDRHGPIVVRRRGVESTRRSGHVDAWRGRCACQVGESNQEEWNRRKPRVVSVSLLATEEDTTWKGVPCGARRRMGSDPTPTKGSHGTSKPYPKWHGPLPSMAEQWRHAMRYRSYTSYAWSALVLCGALVYFGVPRPPTVPDSNPDPSLSPSVRKGNETD